MSCSGMYDVHTMKGGYQIMLGVMKVYGGTLL